ncbi:MAG: hypothetical protein IT349_10485 [Candidatus Eisenbacteria bacterium]|nr:hypothetical protein [Candidatus Eisenbacteria bacterium]MCC7142516.1 hypothetical protein [Candidatus Eisenbacteria bacterium]
MRTTKLAICVLASLLTASGCSKESTQPLPEAPALPPAESLQIDLGFFQQPARAPESAAPETIFNWTNAVVRVLVINAFVDAALSPPFEAFEVALNTTPTLRQDGTWVWTYGVLEGGRTARIDLEGVERSGKVEWSLYLTDSEAEPPLNHGLWFEGETTGNGEEGFWLFLDPRSSSSGNYARLNWRVKAEDDAELRLEALDRSEESFGDFVLYEVDRRDARVTYHDASERSEFIAKWNTATGAGSLVAPDYNQGAPACWNSEQQDIECSTVAPGPR